MVSVTQRIKQIKQPHGGYLPKRLFKYHKFLTPKINYNRKLSTTIGMTVDYLSRYVLGSMPSKAFEISLQGARLVGKEDYVKDLLKNINRSLDDCCILSACKIVQYDCYVRGTKLDFKVNEEIKIDNSTLDAVRKMVQRVVSILKDNTNKILKFNVKFPCPADYIVKQGDADFMTDDTLWDIKVSDKPINSKYTLQLLMYYLQSTRSTIDYSNIKYLALYSPLTDEVYYISVNDISDKTKYEVNNKVFGFKLSDNDDYSQWNNLNGLDEYVLDNYYKKLDPELRKTDFNFEDYNDGIYRISIDDYCTYYSKLDIPYAGAVWNAKFSYTSYILMLKKEGFSCFISVSQKGKLSILRGGSRKNLNRNIKYYYDYLDIFGKRIISIFKPYWDVIFKYASILKNLDPDDNLLKEKYMSMKKELGQCFNMSFSKFKSKYKIPGKVHGCIIDIDPPEFSYYRQNGMLFFSSLNHLYLNPFTGKIESYYAEGMTKRKYYKSPQALIRYQLHPFLESFKQVKPKLEQLETKSQLFIQERDQLNSVPKDLDLQIESDQDTIFSSDTETYKISNLLFGLQRIYTDGLIQIWNDAIIIGAKSTKQEKTISN